MEDKEMGRNSKRSYRGGCAETLCCGHTLQYGTWSDQYFCYDQYAITVDEEIPLRFKCVEGAKNLAIGAMSVAAAVFMMS